MNHWVSVYPGAKKWNAVGLGLSPLLQIPLFFQLYVSKHIAVCSFWSDGGSRSVSYERNPSVFALGHGCWGRHVPKKVTTTDWEQVIPTTNVKTNKSGCVCF